MYRVLRGLYVGRSLSVVVRGGGRAAVGLWLEVMLLGRIKQYVFVSSAARRSLRSWAMACDGWQGVCAVGVQAIVCLSNVYKGC